MMYNQCPVMSRPVIHLSPTYNVIIYYLAALLDRGMNNYSIILYGRRYVDLCRCFDALRFHNFHFTIQLIKIPISLSLDLSHFTRRNYWASEDNGISFI